MTFSVGQAVKFKTDSPSFDLPKDAGMEVLRTVLDGSLVCVAITGRGAHWIKAEDLQAVESIYLEEVGAQRS